MDIYCYEVLIDGLTLLGKVWARGEVILRSSVPTKVCDIWDNPKRQMSTYGMWVARPRPQGYTGQVDETMVSALGVAETIGSGAGRPGAKVGPNPPPLGPGAEIGVSGMARRA